MQLTITSWNGDASINDGTHYTSMILPGSLFNLNGQPVYADRAENFAYLSGMVLPAHSFTFRVKSLTNPSISTAREILKGIFNITDPTPHALIATDESAVQWQIVGFPTALVADTGQGSQGVNPDTLFLITLAVAEPVWQKVTATSSVWAVTTTGGTKVVTTPGNILARPKFAIVPTVARTGQFAFNRWVPVYNRSTNALNNYPIDVTAGGLSTTGLVTVAGVSNQINNVAGILSTDVTIAIDTPVGGGLPTVGFGIMGTEQFSWANNTGTSLTGCIRGIGGTVAAAHADNTVINNSKMLANGGDIAVMVDGALANLWITGANTASTKVWIAQNWQVPQAGVLLTALPNNGTQVTVVFTKNNANLLALRALKTARNNTFLVENEAFTYLPANVDLVKYQITLCNRAQKNTSFAAHSAAVAITPIEHDIWFMYGNPAGSPLVVDNTQQPLLDMTNSTNTSWVQTQFFDTASSRPAAWSGQVITSTGKLSSTYTADQVTYATPATELGLNLLNYLVANVWKAETASLVWGFYHPAGIITVSMSGKKFLLAGTAFPGIAGLQKSTNGVIWTSVWNETIPTLNTWTAITHNAVTLSGTFNNIRLALIGTIAAPPSGLVGNSSAIQGDTVTLALSSTLTPSVALNSENAQYFLNCQITNNLTGDYFTLAYTMVLTGTLTVDTDAKTVVYSPDGITQVNAISALALSTTRNDWLPLTPTNNGNVVANNTLQIDDAGIANITITITWKDRNL